VSGPTVAELVAYVLVDLAVTLGWLLLAWGLALGAAALLLERPRRL